MRRFILPLIILVPALAACQSPVPEVLVPRPPASFQVASLDAMPAGVEETARTRITVAASGQAAARHWPEFELLVNGEPAGLATAEADGLVHYIFEAGLAPTDIREVRVRYLNDLEVFDANRRRVEDRNLYVYYLKIGDTRIPASQRTRIVREDGTEMRGQEGLWWNADLIFPLEGRL